MISLYYQTHLLKSTAFHDIFLTYSSNISQFKITVPNFFVFLVSQASASGVTLADHTTEQFDLAIYSGLYATFYYMQACYPYFKETQGSVINFASGYAFWKF